MRVRQGEHRARKEQREDAWLCVSDTRDRTSRPENKYPGIKEV